MGTIIVAGPNSRKLLEKIIDKEYDISNLNFLIWDVKITICNNIPARLFRIFSGELACKLQFLQDMVILCLKF